MPAELTITVAALSPTLGSHCPTQTVDMTTLSTAGRSLGTRPEPGLV